ncbi:hypothetical protein JXA40_03905 [bacterium]|nr:hypothetical protein [candidate division CSSED10-310 bacterium]
MTNNAEFSLEADAVAAWGVPLPDRNKMNRYHFSYAAWQLARMGTYHAAGELPRGIRLDLDGDFLERYAGSERVVGVIDAGKTDLEDLKSFEDFLVRFALKMLSSDRPEALSALIVTSAKRFQKSPPSVAQWPSVKDLENSLQGRLHKLFEKAASKNPVPAVDRLTRQVIQNTSIEYSRRRQGRLGDETLWGKELDMLKVLQDAGISGADLGHAMTSLIDRISNAAGDAGTLLELDFSREDAFLLIRDYQRRAYSSTPAVQVIDQRFLQEQPETVFRLSRQPGWKEILLPAGPEIAIRPDYEAAVKWARRCAKISGRGLLPVFLFTGRPGMGKSILLKQVARELYLQGFVVAEILDIEKAAEEAEHLATAAVACDAPLILLWDDPLGYGTDPVPWIKELAAAQISGAPMAVLGTAVSVDQYPKFFSRTVLEEYTVHPLSPDEAKLPVSPESEPTTIELWSQSASGTTLDELARQIAGTIPNSASKDLYRTIVALGVLGLSTPDRLLEAMHSEKAVRTFQKALAKEKNQPVQMHSDRAVVSPALWDAGHPVLCRAIWSSLNETPEQTDILFDKIINTCGREPDLQVWIVRILQAALVSADQSFSVTARILSAVSSILDGMPDLLSTKLLSRLFPHLKDSGQAPLFGLLTKVMTDRVHLAGVDAFSALSPLLRNQLGGLTEVESLKALNSAKPSMDRIGFRFLLKYLGDHMPGDLGSRAVEDARTAAARDPDNGHAVDAYLQLVAQRGSNDQIERAVQETKSWLKVNPEDRVVWRSFMDLILKKCDPDTRSDILEPLESWLGSHFDEGPLRTHYLDLAVTLNDPQLLDRALHQTASWIKKIGNNRSVRRSFFRLSEQRNDKDLMLKACDVALSWLSHHPDDRETIQSLLFLAARVKSEKYISLALEKTHQLLVMHPLDNNLLKRYLIQVDRDGSSRHVHDAVLVAETYLDENPEDTEIRKIILGLAAKKLDKKIQNRIYSKNCMWLDTQTDVPGSFEYLIGRLGVRAGIARRAIPLLERAGARDDSTLKNHALLWLGSAYRISGEYLDARKTWNRVLDVDDENMKIKAQKNLESLESFLAKKFPDGYPPKEEPRVRPDRKSRARDAATPDRPRPTGVESGVSALGSVKPKRSATRIKRSKPERKPVDKHPRPEGPRQGTTLGDLLRLKGLDLKSELAKSKKKK